MKKAQPSQGLLGIRVAWKKVERVGKCWEVPQKVPQKLRHGISMSSPDCVTARPQRWRCRMR